ncbi:MAG: hypothetical protein J0M00_02715 [Burkholderiales bacterium]|nr:hypothetical protein [Burkholderiales bacterium]
MLKDEPAWLERVSGAPHLHLAVLVEPYLGYLLTRRKTIESRFSITRVAPFETVERGDVVLLKRSGGPVVGLALVGRTEFVHLAPNTWAYVKSFSREICADAEFWESRRAKRYATLMQVDDITDVEPFTIDKGDRRAWVVLDQRGTLL